MGVRRITSGPNHHWFGYYDKQQMDPSQRYVLGMEIGFEHRSPTAGDAVTIGMVDLEDGDRWIELGTTLAWCWQQGCMLQWLPGSDSEIVWNDRDGDHYVCHIMDVHTREQRTLPNPVYTVAPDGKSAFAPDFSRIQHRRPGYGYAGVPDPYEHVGAPEESGLWRIDLETGARELIITIAQVAAMDGPRSDIADAVHYFNHLLVNPDGSLVEFLHRWRMPGSGRATRMLVVGVDGVNPRVIDDNGNTSHFIWLDSERLLAWSGAESDRGDFCIFNVRTGEVTAIGREKMTRDGHVNCMPGSDWLVNDAYPGGERERPLYLYHMPTDERIELGAFYSPPEYGGEWRCDLHPRISRDGTRVIIDSAHEEGLGRQMYLVDGVSLAPKTEGAT